MSYWNERTEGTFQSMVQYYLGRKDTVLAIEDVAANLRHEAMYNSDSRRYRLLASEYQSLRSEHRRAKLICKDALDAVIQFGGQRKQREISGLVRARLNMYALPPFPSMPRTRMR